MPETDIDQLKRRRLYVQLEMFGRPEVTTAFDEAGAANKRWISGYATLRSMLQLNHDVAAGLRPPPSAYTAAEIEPLQLAVKLARKVADDRDAQLLAAIQEAAQRVPKRPPVARRHRQEMAP